MVLCFLFLPLSFSLITTELPTCFLIIFFKFVNVEAPLTASQIKVYDTAVHVW